MTKSGREMVRAARALVFFVWQIPRLHCVPVGMTGVVGLRSVGMTREVRLYSVGTTRAACVVEGRGCGGGTKKLEKAAQDRGGSHALTGRPGNGPCGHRIRLEGAKHRYSGEFENEESEPNLDEPVGFRDFDLPCMFGRDVHS